jgi:hypothetical protein
MPTIEVSDDTFEALKRLAEPLVDTSESVIQRLLASSKSASNAATAKLVSAASRRVDGKRARRGEVTPREVYRDALIKVLRDAGGMLETREAIERVGGLLHGRLRAIDLARLPTGEDRWINAVRFARKELIDEGILDRSAAHGVWRLKK